MNVISSALTRRNLPAVVGAGLPLPLAAAPSAAALLTRGGIGRGSHSVDVADTVAAGAAAAGVTTGEATRAFLVTGLGAFLLFLVADASESDELLLLLLLDDDDELDDEEDDDELELELPDDDDDAALRFLLLVGAGVTGAGVVGGGASECAGDAAFLVAPAGLRALTALSDSSSEDESEEEESEEEEEEEEAALAGAVARRGRLGQRE